MVNIAQAWTDFSGHPSGTGTLDTHWERWREAAGNEEDGSQCVLIDAVSAEPGARALFTAIFDSSPYLTRCLLGDLPFAQCLIEHGPDAAFQTALDGAGASAGEEDGKQLMERLRRAKRRAALAAGMADIASAWSVETVTGRLSHFAETALGTSCSALLRTLHDKGNLTLPDRQTPESGSGLFILGMGKLGARELNYSSDIDLIVLFDPDSAPATDNSGLQQMFTRLAQGLVRIISEQTAQGYVFRTDLRLRPDPGSTPPAVSVRSAKTYYRKSARNWERAAMIKARVVAGDTAAGERFIESLHPFVWRRHLDFAAMQDIRSIKQQIDTSRNASGSLFRGHSVKLGRGGIREVEFFVQAQQLVWGGRDPDLRLRGTCETLDKLVVKGHVTHRCATELKAAYRFLRRLEHRLQMVNDQQTHSLPDSEEGIRGIAAFMGMASAEDLRETLGSVIDTVEQHYAMLFQDKVAIAQVHDLVFDSTEHEPDTRETLVAMGYADPARIAATVQVWTAGRYPALRNDQARNRLLRLVSAALSAFAALPDPDALLRQFDDFLARMPVGTELFSLLEAHPELFGLLAEIMGSAPRLANWLTRYPILFDSILSREFADLDLDDEGLDPETADAARRGLVRLFYLHELDKEEMKAQLAGAVSQAVDLQDRLDIVRRWANDRIFQIGVHMLRGLLSPVEAGGPLSSLADVCIATLLPSLKAEFAAEHGHVPGSRFAVVAFGKLGSREMTVNSDLDLMFLYDHAPEAVESDGRRPLDVTRYYARLCRRLISAVTALTPQGKLYDVDMRLRPSGNAGPIACSLTGFEDYQRTRAWTWEHQALTRARIIYAEDDLGERFERIQRAVLCIPRSRGKLAADVTDMRERMRREYGGGSIKHMPGGLVDIEFIAQFLQLLHASAAPEILCGDVLSVYGSAGALGLIDDETARDLSEAATLWRNLQGMMRLTIGDETVENAAVGRFGGKLVTDALSESIEDVAHRVAQHFATIVGGNAG